MSKHTLSCRQALGCVISVMRPSSTSFAAILPVSCPSKIHPVRQWLPVFWLNGRLLPSVSPIMWLSVVPDGVGIKYQRRPHSVPMASSFSINDASIQYQWPPRSVPMTPSFSTNDDITVWASSCCMPFVVMSLFVMRCYTVIYVFVLRICHSRPLPPFFRPYQSCEPSSVGKIVSCAGSAPELVILFLVFCVGIVGRARLYGVLGLMP